MMDRRRRTLRPAVDPLEGRALLSSLGPKVAGSHSLHARVTGGSGGGGAAGGDTGSTPGQGPQGDATDYFTPTGTPTPHERARQQFYAAFTGTYVQGGGRYSTQSRSLSFRGAGKGSYFLHGDAQMGLVTPADPSRPISGSLTMFDRNNNTNFAYGIDLSADQVTDVDRFGRPTRLTYTTDVNLSSGLAAESIGQGTVTIRYLSAGGSSRGISARGTAVMLIRGTIYTLGANQNLRNANINS